MNIVTCQGMMPLPTRRARVLAYLKRFATSWVKEDPDPGYSSLDEHDGLGQVPDPIERPAA